MSKPQLQINFGSYPFMKFTEASKHLLPCFKFFTNAGFHHFTFEIQPMYNLPPGLHQVQNPQSSVNSRVEETKTLETLHDPSDLHPVRNQKNFREL